MGALHCLSGLRNNPISAKEIEAKANDTNKKNKSANVHLGSLETILKKEEAQLRLLWGNFYAELLQHISGKFWQINHRSFELGTFFL